MLSRREWLRHTAGTGAGILTAPFVNLGRSRLFAQNEYSTRTVDLVRQSVVIDMLGLLTLNWQKLERWQASPLEFSPADRNKIKDSGITVFHPAVDVNTPDPYATVSNWMRGWNRFISQEPHYFVRVDTAEDLRRAKRENKIGIILGLQNSDHFRSVADVRRFHQLGQRISQLTYNEQNQIGTGCTEHTDSGLSPFGVQIVEQMNACGMAIDVSHSGERTTLDAIAASKSPILITHSNCRTLVPLHPRCKSDEIIRRMANSGGVMGITSIRSFVRSTDNATLGDVLNHFDYTARLVGIEHVGVGSDTDLDGRDRGLSLLSRNRMDIDGLNHPKRIYDLTEGLVKRGYTNAQIEGILGGNFRRALQKIWA